MKIVHCAPLCAAVLLHVAPSMAAYDYKTYDYPGATATGLVGINDLGVMIGIFQDAVGVHSFVLEHGRAALIDPDGVVGQSSSGQAYSINALGVIVGSYQDAAGVVHGFVLKDGVVSPVEYPGGFPTEVYAINDFGHMVGGYYTPDQNVHAFSLVNGVYKNEDVPGALTTAPYGINDLGEIAGYFLTVAGTNGQAYFRAPDGTLTTYNVPGAPANSTNFLAINNLGETLGNYVDAAGNLDNFLLVGGKVEPIVLPASFGSLLTAAEAINDTGELVGFYVDPNSKTHSFIRSTR
jgi:uncharacterized membrane protein